MEKEKLYLVVAIIIAIVIVIISGEYFAYKYSALSLQNSKQSEAQNTTVKPSIEQKQPQSLSSDKLISSFKFDGLQSIGDVDQTEYTVNVNVPVGTNISNLKPIIEISKNAKISPESGVSQNFSKPVAYLVTAQDGLTRTYIVNLTMVKSGQKAIIAFLLKGFYPIVNGDINETSHTVYAVVPDGTDLTKIAPIITVSNNATIFPVSGIKRDFTMPIIYTVLAQDGSMQDYTIMVVTESNSG